MPSASDQQRHEWGGALGICEDKAETHLTDRGWTITPHWMCIPPERFIEIDEWDALQFLINEWDYGYGGPGKGIQFGDWT